MFSQEFKTLNNIPIIKTVFCNFPLTYISCKNIFRSGDEMESPVFNIPVSKCKLPPLGMSDTDILDNQG